MEKEEGGRTEEEKEEGGRGGGLGRGRGSGRKGVACRRRADDGDQVVLDDGQDRGEAGKIGDNRKSRTSAEEGGRETRGGLEMAYTAARHGHDTQRAEDTDTRTHGHGGQETREVKTSIPDVCAPPSSGMRARYRASCASCRPSTSS